MAHTLGSDDARLVAARSLQDVRAARERIRLVRGGHWFLSVVFGTAILGALPFYVTPSIGPATACRPHCELSAASAAPLGRAFSAQPFASLLGSWSTVYWTIAVLVGFGAVAVYYRHRGKKLGVEIRLWPSGLAGGALLALALWLNRGSSAGGGALWIEGTTPLLIIAVIVVVDAFLERSRSFSLFAGGYVCVAVLGTVYEVVNLFRRIGIAGPFDGPNHNLPNLILPGAYLVIGGLTFLVHRQRALQRCTGASMEVRGSR